LPVVSGVVAQDGDVSADGAAGLAGGDGHGVDGGELVDEQSLPVGGGKQSASSAVPNRDGRGSPAEMARPRGPGSPVGRAPWLSR